MSIRWHMSDRNPKHRGILKKKKTKQSASWARAPKTKWPMGFALAFHELNYDQLGLQPESLSRPVSGPMCPKRGGQNEIAFSLSPPPTSRYEYLQKKWPEKVGFHLS